MSDRLRWTTTIDADWAVVALSGRVDETANFAALVAGLEPVERLRLDLGGITRINSSGVREWVRFLRQLTGKGQLELERCSPAVVTQLNMIGAFAGSARVISVYAPYVCETCNATQNILVETRLGSSPQLTAVACENCRTPMIFDDIEEHYFAFLRV